MDIAFKTIIFMVFLSLGLIFSTLSDKVRRGWVNFMVGHEQSFKKIPVFGGSTRGFILWLEREHGTKIVYYIGILCIFISLLILVFL